MAKRKRASIQQGEQKKGQQTKHKAKPCDRCAQSVTTRYRIQLDASGDWHLVCRSCWNEVSHDNPHYRYGGTWKAKSKI